MKYFVFLLILIMASLAPVATFAQDESDQDESAQNEPAAKAPPCSEPEARQFDFWAGEWNVISQGKVGGHSRISRIHGNCTILEEYDTAPGPYEGKSFSYYDARDTSWHQVWVDNSGLRLHLVGGFADDKMVMSADRLGAAKPTIDRITWTDNDDGTVRQEWDVSQDNGETWQNVFDGLYQPVTKSDD